MRALPAIVTMLIALLAVPAWGQDDAVETATGGTVTGRLRDRAGTTLEFGEGTVAVALALPAQSPPFCEIASAAWSEVFAIAAAGEEREPEFPFGGIVAGINPAASFRADVSYEGAFTLAGLPFKQRLALAVRVDGLWRPLREEVWLTEESPTADVEVPFYTLGAERESVRVSRHTLELAPTLRPDLKYVGFRVIETLVIENSDPDRAYLPVDGDFITLPAAPPPGLSARMVGGMYGSQLSFFAGTDAAKPGPAPDGGSGQEWQLGSGGGMHGQAATYGPGPQQSVDARHQLNLDGALMMVLEGDTLFRVAGGGTSMEIVFNRPVPPAVDGKPGALIVRLMFKTGLLRDRLKSKLPLLRVLDLPVDDLRVVSDPLLEVTALVEEEHRSLLGEPEADFDGLMLYDSVAHEGALIEAGRSYTLAVGFSELGRRQIAQMDEEAQKQAEAAIHPESTGGTERKGPDLDRRVLFSALAVIFGLAFVAALVSTFRGTRKRQLAKLARTNSSRAEMMAALIELEHAYKAGEVPAASYLEQRKRLQNRLLELETRKPDTDDE